MKKTNENMVMCAWCGELHNVDEMTSPDGVRYYCSDTCLRFSGWSRCDRCGEWYELGDGFRTAGRERRYCSESCAKADGCVRCEWCGGWVHPTQATDTGHGVYCCRGCARRGGWIECMDCGEWVSYDGSRLIEGYGDVCEDCLEVGEYGQCCECGYWYRYEDLGYNPHTGTDMCDACREEYEESDCIHNYSYKPLPYFYGSNGVHMGIELEIDKSDAYGYQRAELSRALHELDCCESHYYQKADCSLEDGIEIVSHPMTLTAHASYIWPDVLGLARDHGYKSHDAGTCGLHVHVSRAYAGGYSEAEEWGMRMWSIVESNRDAFTRFSRRTSYQLGHWASFDNPDDVRAVKDAPTCEKYDVWSTCTSGNKRGRYHAINYQNGNTIEFRLFRGTLNYQTLLATLALVDGVARYAKAYSLEACEQCGFKRLAYWVAYTCVSPRAGRALLEYCKSRGLV